ncbi:MAG: DUF1289 domain-containing protein [Solimonas sp.]
MTIPSISAGSRGGSEIASPCTRVCRIGARGHCVGCGRDLDEIVAWPQASDAQKRAIRARAAARLRDFRSDLSEGGLP